MSLERAPLEKAGNIHGCRVQIICKNSGVEPVWDESQRLVTRGDQTMTQASASYVHTISNVRFLIDMHSKYCHAEGPKGKHQVLVKITLPTDDEGPCYFNLFKLLQKAK